MSTLKIKDENGNWMPVPFLTPIPDESDPTVPAHVKNITEEDIAKWNAGGITNETDPTVPTHVKNITQEEISNWNNPKIPTKTSQLQNDSGFLTEHQDISNLATKAELNNKQDKLVAGDNIIITGNTISSKSSGDILIFENITVETSLFVEDATYEEFGYKAEIQCTGVTAEFFSDVTFDVTEAISGNYAPISLTGAGTVTIYAVDQPESTITIPSIICSKGA